MEAPSTCPDPVALGRELRLARRRRKFTQKTLARAADVDLSAVANLEAGRGTVASLVAVLTVLQHRFSEQGNGVDPGRWLATRRQIAGWSQERLSQKAGLSKPTVIQLERGRGYLASLCAMLRVLEVPILLRPEEEVLQVKGMKPVHALACEVINEDCVAGMRRIDAARINLVVTSPPYNASKPYEDPLTTEEYTAHAREWCSELPRLLSSDGALWLNVGYMKLTATTTRPLTYLFQPILEELGLHLVQEIVWHYEGGMAYKRRFAHRTERWMWFVKDPKRFKFNLDAVRDQGLNRTTDSRNNPLGKNPTDLWYFDRVAAGSRAKTDHPCQFPVAMIERIVRACSNPGDTVLDCYGGSGTTAVAAAQNGRGYISIEKDPIYHQISRDRLRRLKLLD